MGVDFHVFAVCEQTYFLCGTLHETTRFKINTAHQILNSGFDELQELVFTINDQGTMNYCHLLVANGNKLASKAYSQPLIVPP